MVQSDFVLCVLVLFLLFMIHYAGGVHLHRRKFEVKSRVHKAYSFVGR
jgi:hypothetical protein